MISESIPSGSAPPIPDAHGFADEHAANAPLSGHGTVSDQRTPRAAIDGLSSTLESPVDPRSETGGDIFEGRFLHACPFSNGLTIDEFDNEIIHCRCFDTPEILQVQDNRAVLMDARRT